MKNEIAYTKNIERAFALFNLLNDRSQTIPGMGLIKGAPGTGKTKCLEWFKRNPESSKGIFLRANRGFSPYTLLSKLLIALDLPANRRNAAMLETICGALENSQQYIFIDEADYLFNYPASLDYLRDIHDETQIPIVLIGMADGGSKDIHRRLASYKQLNRRVSRRIDFLPCDLDDVELIAETCCEIAIDRDALADIHQETKGNIGLICNALEVAERAAKSQEWTCINAAQRKAVLSRGGAA